MKLTNLGLYQQMIYWEIKTNYHWIGNRGR